MAEAEAASSAMIIDLKEGIFCFSVYVVVVDAGQSGYRIV